MSRPTSFAARVARRPEVVVSAERHVQAAPASVALLLACSDVLDLWPGAGGQDGGSALLPVGPPRRLRTSYETEARWTGLGAMPGSAVLRVSPQGRSGTLLRLQLCCTDDLGRRLRPAADRVLAELAHRAEVRALAG
ncbi:MAG: hypothetical protein ACLGI3_10545 [Actinomycetes bacterium]